MLSKLFRYIRGYEKAAILAPVLVIIEIVCELWLPQIMAKIIDDGIQGAGGLPLILRCAGVMLVLSICFMTAGVTSVKFCARAAQGFGANLRKAMFDHVQEFSFFDIDRFSSASLITRLTNDVNNIQSMVNMGLRIIVRAPVTLLASLFVCYRLDSRLAVVLFCVVPAMALAIALLMRVCHRLFENLQRKIDGLNDTVQENLIGIRVVKAFVRETYEKQKFKKANDDLYHGTLAAVTRVMFMTPIMYNISLVPEKWLPFYQLNPMVSVVTAYRAILYAGEVPKLETLGIALGMGVLFLALGFLIFGKLKRRFSEVI